MTNDQFFSKSSRDTKNLAATLARKRIRIVALVGDLGSGKTTFVQGLARELGIRRRITSPTFIIMNKHHIPRSIATSLPLHSRRITHFYHIDLYRVHRSRDLRLLGFKELLRNRKNFVAIEWAERAKRFIPRSATWVTFQHGVRSNERIVIVK